MPTSCLNSMLVDFWCCLPGTQSSFPQLTHQKTVLLSISAAQFNGIHLGAGNSNPGTEVRQSNKWLKNKLVDLMQYWKQLALFTSYFCIFQYLAACKSIADWVNITKRNIWRIGIKMSAVC